MNTLFTGWRPYVWLTLLCAILYIPGIFSLPPLDRDEARYMQASRQMVESGDYVHIRFQDKARTKKPVGIYWLQAGAVNLLSPDRPDRVWPYRVPSVIALWAAALMAFAWGKHLFGRPAAFAAAGLLAASVVPILEAHQAKTDAVLLATTVAAMGALARSHLASHGVGPPLTGRNAAEAGLVFWIAVGVGILVKGPLIVMVAGLAVLALAVGERRLDWFKALRPGMGVIVVLAIVAPWFLAIQGGGEGPGFVTRAIENDLLPKLLKGHESHGAPPGYHVLLMILFLWPASLLVWPALRHAWRERARVPVRFCLAWLVPSWIVLELVPTKLPHYPLPLYPALTLLAGAALVAFVDGRDVGLHGRGIRWYYAGWGLLGLALAAAVVVAPRAYGLDAGGWTALPAVLFAVAGLVPGFLAWRGSLVRAAVTASVAGGLAVTSTLAVAMPSMDGLWLSRQARAMVAEHSPVPGPTVAATGYHEPSLVFLLGRRTNLTGPQGAATALDTGHADLALVTHKDLAAFRAAAAKRGLDAKRLDTAHGLNYAEGEVLDLVLFGRSS